MSSKQFWQQYIPNFKNQKLGTSSSLVSLLTNENVYYMMTRFLYSLYCPSTWTECDSTSLFLKRSLTDLNCDFFFFYINLNAKIEELSQP